jgi:hypothetical protein
VERNPHLLLEGEPLAIVARQPRNPFGKFLDLLAIDETGATVVIELKRGVTPREVIAQSLEYAAWVESLSIEQLDEMAREYATRQGLEGDGLAFLYDLTFLTDPSAEADEESEDSARVTFNNRQRIVIVAERISDEVEQTLRYLRTSYGLDVHGVEFRIHKAGQDTLINTTTVVGRERPKKPDSGPRGHVAYDDEALRERAGTDFMVRAVTAIEEWVVDSGVPGLHVEHGSKSKHRVRHSSELLIVYNYAANWLLTRLYAPTDEEIAVLRAGLSDPDELYDMMHRRNPHWRFHVRNDDDLDLVKRIIMQRVAAAGHKGRTR